MKKGQFSKLSTKFAYISEKKYNDVFHTHIAQSLICYLFTDVAEFCILIIWSSQGH